MADTAAANSVVNGMMALEAGLLPVLKLICITEYHLFIMVIMYWLFG